MKKQIIGLCVFLVVSTLAFANNTVLTAHNLLCENRSNPLGIDNPNPQFNWQLASNDKNARGLAQSAYQILVASSVSQLDNNVGDWWDSTKVISADNSQIVYAGKPLISSQKLYWKVRFWNEKDQVSNWSLPANFITGVLKKEDWRDAQWIGLADIEAQSTQLRKVFFAKQQPLRAILHITGLGQYELQLNGKKVGQDILTPGWTDYRKTILYDTYDLTEQINSGANAFGITLGNGAYSVDKTENRYNKFVGSFGDKKQRSEQKAIAILQLEYADGSSEFVKTDKTWQVSKGPITYSNLYGGEDFDARLVQPGWAAPAFTGKWPNAKEVAAPEGKLTGLSAAGIVIRIIETLNVRTENIIAPNLSVVDLGQNAALIPRIRVIGEAGARVRITPSELVRENGEINDTMTKAQAYWDYTLAGHGEEAWLPQFFYRGARYLQIELFPAKPGGALPKLLSVQGEVIHAAADTAGSFSSSNDLFNRIYTLVRWAQRSNMMSVFTDCPQREKLGWLEENYLNGPALRYNFALNPLFSKMVNDVVDTQQPNGLIPNIAPEYVVFGWWKDIQFRESAEWGSALIQVPWQQYVFTGDLQPVRVHYTSMKKYMDYLKTFIDDKGLLHIPGALGDWYDIGPKPPSAAQLTPIDLTASAIYYDNLNIMTRFAHELQKPDDAEQFQKLAAILKANFNRAYFDSASVNYATGSQTANSMPVVLGLTDKKKIPRVIANIVKDVNANALTSGDVGYRYLLRSLADAGRSDVIYAMNNQSETPGYGYQLKKNATSLTEAWDAGSESSQNHFMLGQINEWLFHDLAGIQPDPSAPGFRNVIVRPAIVGDLTFVSASYMSKNGKISSRWHRTGKVLTFNLEIPANSTARLYLPARKRGDIFESGKPWANANGIRLVTRDANQAVFELVSGTYEFRSEL